MTDLQDHHLDRPGQPDEPGRHGADRRGTGHHEDEHHEGEHHESGHQSAAEQLKELAVKPKLRGVLHTYAFYVSLITGIALVFLAGGLRARVAAVAYALSVSALFGTSALYHRVTWTPRARRWMRRLDHSMIYLLIAGTYTPFGVLFLGPPLGPVVLWVVWVGAVLGIGLKLVWIDAPKWLSAVLYLALAWIGAVTLPSMWTAIGALATVLVAVGGLLYTAGALVYALRRPDPLPTVFGYHEIFHALVIAAAGVQYAVVAYALQS